MAPFEGFEKEPGVGIQSDRSASPSPLRKNRRFWEKLGFYNIAVLSVGTCAIFLALAFLLFIWVAATNANHGGYFPFLWQTIVEHKWTTRVITVSTVLIRVAAAAQLGVFAAIIAALIIERIGASAEDFPLLSMIRCSNTGPQSLIWNVLHSIPVGAQLGYSLLIVLAILNAFALQFTSTILLTDFDNARVVLASRTNLVNYGLAREGRLGNTNTYTGIDFWKAGPATYPRFAEYKEAGSSGINHVDTGRTYRGFLPFRNPDERASLRNYTGPMTIVDVRTVCVKPELSNLTIVDGGAESLPLVSGTLHWSDAHGAITSSDEEGRTFNCMVPAQDADDTYGLWTASLCELGTLYARLKDGIRLDDDPALATGHTSAHLLLNATLAKGDWSDLIPEEASLNQMSSPNGPWAKMGRENVTFDVSLCFLNPDPGDYEATAWSEKDSADATLKWSNTTGAYDTESIRHLFGAVQQNLSLDDRGLFNLQSTANWTARQTDLIYHINTTDFLWDASIPATQSSDETQGTTFMLMPWAPPAQAIHRSHLVIAQHILKSTGNPALALQTLTFIILQMAYYDFLPQFHVNASATYSASTSILIPTQWTAFAVVLGLLAIHFALIVTAVILFLTKTEMSLLGNSWQAVSQVVSTDTADVVHHGATSTDGEVKSSFQKSGIAQGKIWIRPSASNGRTEATSVRRRQGIVYGTASDRS